MKQSFKFFATLNFLFLSFCSVTSYSQEGTFFDINSVKFKGFSIKILSPLSMRFSDDERFLFIISSNGSQLRLSKYKSENGNLISAKDFNFSQFRDFQISPDNKSILLTNERGLLYYWYDFENKKDYLKTGDIETSYYFFAANNLIYLKSGATGYAFDIDKWGYRESGILGIDGSKMAKIRNETLKGISLQKPNYEIYFGNDQEKSESRVIKYGLWIKAPNSDYTKRLVLDIKTLGSEYYIKTVSHNYNRVAYYNGNVVLLMTPLIEAKSTEYFCFELKNTGDREYDNRIFNLLKNIREKLAEQDVIMARVCFPRFHPITNEPLGAGTPKSWLQIVKLENTILYGRFSENIIANSVISEKDFIDMIYGPYDSHGHTMNFTINLPIAKCADLSNNGSRAPLELLNEPEKKSINTSEDNRFVSSIKYLEIKVPAGGANGLSVVYHPKKKLYYAAQAGNESFPLLIFTPEGNIISEKTQTTMIDVRGLWYNPRTNELAGNAYKDFGWFTYNLNENGIAESITVFKRGIFQPDDNSSGVLNSAENEVLFLSGTKVLFYSTNGLKKNKMIQLHIGSKNMNSADLNENFERDYNTRSLIYTGSERSEIGLLNISKNQVELYDIQTGYLTLTVNLPLDFKPESFFNFSYSNGIYWVFNKESRFWVGFKTEL